MDKELTLASLFDGSGGFPLGGMLAGIRPVWSSEVEPFAIRVTTKRLSKVKHYGDITKIKGNEVEPVDIITFGSPCQDMSIAGKRAGLDGSRSNLFYEAIRIVKEMRCATNGEKPRYIVWENVTGAFSSNKGDDFKSVLDEICKVKHQEMSIPKPTKWEQAGTIMGDDFSIAWRVFDAQFWGVPQRRNRIYLVADFGGNSASKILFESEGLSGYSKESFRSWQDSTRNIEDSIRKSSKLDLFENHSQDLRYKGPLDIAPTILSTYGTGGNNQPFVVHSKNYDVRLTSEGTKNARNNVYETETSRTLDTNGNFPNSNQGGVAIVYSTSKSSFHIRASENLANTLIATDYMDPPIVNDKLKVRRLTPKECARLQGFPDWWCSNLETKEPTKEEVEYWREIFNESSRAEGKNKREKTDSQIIKWLQNPHSDSAEYKLWGNGVALPCVYFVLSGIEYYAHMT